MPCTDQAPKVSVIMGAYNIASLTVFQRAIASVLEQTMQDFEFIICDDGSTDETWRLLQELSQKDSRIRLLRNSENLGLATTLNRCLEAAHADLIARQDADDLSKPERLYLQSEFLVAHPEIDFVGSHVTLWDEQSVWGCRQFPKYPCPRDFLYTMPFVHGALMFRKRALEKVNGYRVAKETRRAEDYDMLMRMYAAGLQGANIQTILYEFLEDQAAHKRRKYRYRIDEMIVRWKGFRRLGLMPHSLPYVIKPLIAGLLPASLLRSIRKKREF